MVRAWSWFSEEKFDSARVAAEKTLIVRFELLGEAYPEVAETIEGLAIVLCQLDQYSEAEGHLRRALAMRRRLQGLDHPATLSTVDTLIGVLRIQGKEAEAEQVYLENERMLLHRM